MSLNVVDAILSGQLNLNVFKVAKALIWDFQILGAYSFLYPYIAKDFRGKLDCSLAHVHLDPPQPTSKLAELQINYFMHPFAKRGGSNVGTYSI
jgi:hypothetical protein